MKKFILSIFLLSTTSLYLYKHEYEPSNSYQKAIKLGYLQSQVNTKLINLTNIVCKFKSMNRKPSKKTDLTNTLTKTKK